MKELKNGIERKREAEWYESDDPEKTNADWRKSMVVTKEQEIKECQVEDQMRRKNRLD